ncbi:MAG: OB-fold domain-containing protein [Rhizomicrobium sp.]
MSDPKPAPRKIAAPRREHRDGEVLEGRRGRQAALWLVPRLQRGTLLSAQLLPVLLFGSGGVARGQRRGDGLFLFHHVPFADRAYTIAFVELAEGPRILTNIVDCDFEKIAIDAAVKLVWKPSEGGAPVPFFTLT